MNANRSKGKSLIGGQCLIQNICVHSRLILFRRSYKKLHGIVADFGFDGFRTSDGARMNCRGKRLAANVIGKLFNCAANFRRFRHDSDFDSIGILAPAIFAAALHRMDNLARQALGNQLR